MLYTFIARMRYCPAYSVKYSTAADLSVIGASRLTDIDMRKNDGNGESQNHSVCGLIFSPCSDILSLKILQ
jgi:hypothetical protein